MTAQEVIDRLQRGLETGMNPQSQIGLSSDGQIIWLEPDKVLSVAVMPRVNGETFRCEECNANVFSELNPRHPGTHRYRCNGCLAEYTGE